MKRTVNLFCLLLLLIHQACQQPTMVKQPNVLFIAIDDLNDWTSSLGGHPQAITPNLDRLAQMGTTFTNAHASMAVCVASRNSLLSGMHPTSTGWYSLVKDHDAMAQSYNEVMGDRQMLPSKFKANGYNTWCAGKIFHKGATDFEFITDDLWDDILPEYKEKLRAIDYERGGGYKGYKFYPFPKNGSQLKSYYNDKITFGHSLCGGPLDEEDIPEGKMYDELIADYAIDKLKQRHDDPFFLSLGFVRPHVPYTAPRRYFDLYNTANISIPELKNDDMNDIPNYGKAIAYNYGTNMGDYAAVKGMGNAYDKHLVHSYLACVSFVDDQLGRVLDALENSEYAENTIVVLWSDHGQSFGEKRNYRKMSLWEESTRVPLYISTPNNRNKGSVCSQAVSLLDIYPTLMDLCGYTKASHLDGESLITLLDNPSQKREEPVLISWRYKNYAVRSERFRYIQYRDGSEEFYDHSIDKCEYTNLINNQAYAQQIDWHRKHLPKKVALPVGSKSWTGDELEKTLDEWQLNDNMPSWLR
ncbi:sulfatase [Carboxylicivirga sp. M1479]|uniref:sulfatase n=1 Tax=Carboxylicivirga sp. M1479 TaxID=2594476 RepID=UPI0011775EE7|nr:sulfatase [Carboxylicivirga sp. M1479]TRX66429.1 sulfatase [Carboxylicivirga sp. M1479]